MPSISQSMGIFSNSQSRLVEKLSKASVNNWVCAMATCESTLDIEIRTVTMIFIERRSRLLKINKNQHCENCAVRRAKKKTNSSDNPFFRHKKRYETQTSKNQ